MRGTMSRDQLMRDYKSIGAICGKSLKHQKPMRAFSLLMGCDF